MGSRDWARPVANSDYIILRNAYQAAYGILEDKSTPSKE